MKKGIISIIFLMTGFFLLGFLPSNINYVGFLPICLGGILFGMFCGEQKKLKNQERRLK